MNTEQKQQLLILLEKAMEQSNTHTKFNIFLDAFELAKSIVPTDLYSLSENK